MRHQKKYVIALLLVLFTFSVYSIGWKWIEKCKYQEHTLYRVEKKFLIDVQFLQEESMRQVAFEHIGELFPQEVHTDASILIFTIESLLFYESDEISLINCFALQFDLGSK